MAGPHSGALGAAHILIRILRAFNLVTGVMLIVAIPASFLFEAQFFEFFSKRPPRIDSAWLLPALRLWMVLALAMVAAIHVLLARLLAMVDTVRAGDPFVVDNAVRLQTIAWCALVLQLLHLAFGVMAATVNAAGSNVDWKFSGFTGWLAVLLLFVLARVFEEGTQMREDLQRMI